MPTITIELNDTQAQRLCDAMAEITGFPTTVDCVQQHVINELKSIVARGEKQKADRLAAQPESFDL